MCGIAGIFAHHDSAPTVDRAELLRIREAMLRRGPDGAGLWMSADKRIGLAHRRLAIIDLGESGAQPMATADGSLRITFNGEIYNYRELRRELEGRGAVFRSRSDTEVLLHLYAERGAEMVHALRGMYAFALWDERRQTLFLARDPFGIKPLYYADDGKSVRFASQVKALLAGNAIDLAPEPAGSAGFLLLGAVPEPYTLYRNIRALPAGSTMTVRRGGNVAVRSFFDVRETLLHAQDTPQAAAQAREGLAAAVRESVRAHLIADVPVGVFLSAGVDSATITALACEAGANDMRAVTLGFRAFRGTPDDEVPRAETAARNFGIPHVTEWIERADFERELPQIIAAMDQPTIDGVNTYLVSAAAARAGMKVALSGLGGDELFGGYPSFRQVPRLVSLLGWTRRARRLGISARALTRHLLNNMASPKWAGLLEYGGSYGAAYLLRRSVFMPWELDDLLDPVTLRAGLEELDIVARLDAAAGGLRTPHARICALELAWYMRNQLLRDADWAGMAHSLEIRVPLVDAALFQSLAPAIASVQPPTKTALASAPDKRLPDSLVKRDKTGFSTPLRDWIDSGAVRQPRGIRGWAMRLSTPEGGSEFAPARTRLRQAEACAVAVSYRCVNALLQGAALLLWPRARPLRAEKVLVFRIGQIGDITCALPALRAVRRAYPAAHLTLLTSTGRSNSPGAVELLDGVDWIDEVLSYTADDVATYRGRWRLAMNLRRRRFDAWINLSASPATPLRELRDMVFARLVAPRWARGWRVDTLNWGVQLQSEYLHFSGEVARCLELVTAAGFAPGPVEFGLPHSAVIRTQVDALLPWDGVGAWVAIAPGGRRSTNRWPAGRFAEVGAFLAAQGAGVLLLGGAAETAECARIAAAIGAAAHSLAGRLTLPESCEVLRRCRFAVCIDSGVQHLASAVGTPCLSLFSFWQMRGKWHPYGGENVVLQKWVPCHTCLLDRCPYDNRCMRAIGAAEVIRHAGEKLALLRGHPLRLDETRAETSQPMFERAGIGA